MYRKGETSLQESSCVSPEKVKGKRYAMGEPLSKEAPTKRKSHRHRVAKDKVRYQLKYLIAASSCIRAAAHAIF